MRRAVRAERDRDGRSADRLLPAEERRSAAAAAGAERASTARTPAATRSIGVEAEGHVRIFTPTDQAQGDHAVYDIDQAVLVMTGHALKLTTPNDVLTARDSLEYWSQKHMAVARGNAVVVTNDGRRISADTLVAYTDRCAGGPA